MKGLSKSRYTAFCQCPKNLWLKVYKPNEATIDAGQQARFAQGNVVGDLAMGLFGDFKEAHAEKADGSLDLGDSELDYHSLDERCQNGGDAMTIFPRLQQMEQSLPHQGIQTQDGMLVMADSLMPLSEQIRIREEINASRQALLDYCKLDTWAMVKVWEKLKEMAE